MPISARGRQQFALVIALLVPLGSVALRSRPIAPDGQPGPRISTGLIGPANAILTDSNGDGQPTEGVDRTITILLANATTTAATVQITYLRTDGTTMVKTQTVPPTSRFNVDVNAMVPELVNESFGAVITSSVPIAVERAMYNNSGGVVWAAGTNATATRLP